VAGVEVVADPPSPELGTSLPRPGGSTVCGATGGFRGHADGAADVIRSLVCEIILTPEAGTLQIDVRGDMAGLLV
jgi:site-specific DNA recombinase